MADFKWTKKRMDAAFMLAEGYLIREVANEIGISERTIYRWKNEPTFSEEVDRLTFMLGVATRAERLRVAKRVVRGRLEFGIPPSEKDLLDWLKYLQGETDGIKLDLTSMLEATKEQLAGGGSTGVDQ